MKLLSIALLRREPFPATILAAEYDVSSFGYFQRSRYKFTAFIIYVSYFMLIFSFFLNSIQEFLSFLASTLAEKTVPGIRQAVQQDGTVVSFLCFEKLHSTRSF